MAPQRSKHSIGVDYSDAVRQHSAPGAHLSDEGKLKLGTMPFPDTPRVIYEKNPLEEVICQVRFPPILRIEAEMPAALQEGIRKDYPLFREQPGEILAIPPDISRALGAELRFGTGGRSCEFLTEDEKWKITVTREFLALSTFQYRRWEDFRSHLELPLNEFVKHYGPLFFTRVGLRYRDVIRRSALGLGKAPWSDLLQSYIIGELSDERIEPQIQHAVREVVIVIDEKGGKVRVKHGLVRTNGAGEPCYVIDADFFRDQKTEISDAFPLLNDFNRKAGRLFRWCIKDGLHQAMGPRPIS